MSNIICNVPFCQNTRNPKKSKCEFHTWENRKVPKFKQLIPFWAVKLCNIHGYLTKANCRASSSNKNIQYYVCRSCEKQKARDKYKPIVRFKKHRTLYESTKNRTIKNAYGIEIEDYKNLLLKQNGRCAICFTDKFSSKQQYFHIDHCHKTGKVRGLLCLQCNAALGYFKDSKENLERAIKYLMQEL